MGEPARLLRISPDVYHADGASDFPTLSASIATTLVSRSPLHAWQQHPRLGGAPRKPTAEMDMGSIVHALVLGAGKGIAALPFDDFRTKDARRARDDARNEGMVPILERDLDGAQTAAAAIKRQLGEAGIVLDGESEIAIEWTEESPAGDVRCRGLMDHLQEHVGVVADLKTARDANPGMFERSIVRFGYDIQCAAYTSALTRLHPELAGRVQFLFIVAEVEPPFALMVGRPSGQLLELGERRWARAVETWARCLRSAEWPGYGPGVQWLGVPTWALRAEEEAAEAAQ